MKSLFLIRHAKSSWENPNLRDFDRPLNPRGLRDAPFMAKLLKGHQEQVDVIVSSPANRAISTAHFFAKEFGLSTNAILQKKSIYEAYPEDVLLVIQALDDQHQSALVFGHNPTFTALANQFSKEGEYIANVPTCGIIHIESNVTKWSDLDSLNSKLVAFYYPKQYFN